MLRIRKPAKILFLGEHSAVYGFPVIGATVPIYMDLLYSVSKNWKYLGKPSTKLDSLISFIVSNYSKVNPIEFAILSEIPIGVGLGSSASLSLCFAEYITSHFEYRDCNKILLANQIENIFHGKSSGMDIGLIDLGGTFYLEKKENFLSSKKIKDSGFYFLIGAIKRDFTTKEIVVNLKKQLLSNADLFVFIEKLGLTTSNAYISFQNKDVYSLANEMNVAHHCLKRLGLSNDALDWLISWGIKLGALSGKLSGSGKGGAFIFLFESREKANTAQKELNNMLKNSKINLVLRLKIIEV
ncbi:mevalonate kinase [Borreliella valaisiana]|uniref:mevalonate kinase n=1 Tax=Borreliella valaisiana VS116 TaxID=445987 RepID=D6RW41_BORVA|nr:mevalonate kinase [Borreliella valaisiana]AIJ30036.1 mevalonate kinase [Borreliella valaisiana Tom4006]EEF81509.1 mevalonate kinase [Borreliella valaisiana VS116]WLN25465.1 mevalonate kinase [Borreliella valaisiana]